MQALGTHFLVAERHMGQVGGRIDAVKQDPDRLRVFYNAVGQALGR